MEQYATDYFTRVCLRVKMSLANWLKSGKVSVSSPTVPGLPDPVTMSDCRESLLTQTANSAVETVIKSGAPCASRKRKRGEYSCYDDETRAKIARFAVDNGVAKSRTKVLEFAWQKS